MLSVFSCNPASQAKPFANPFHCWLQALIGAMLMASAAANMSTPRSPVSSAASRSGTSSSSSNSLGSSDWGDDNGTSGKAGGEAVLYGISPTASEGSKSSLPSGCQGGILGYEAAQKLAGWTLGVADRLRREAYTRLRCGEGCNGSF